MDDFETIYAEYYKRIYKYVLCLCRDPSLAEEITQDAFFKAFKGIQGFKGNCKLDSWLCEIAKNCYFSHLKREKNRTKHTSMADSPPGMEELLLEKETAFGVHRALHALREPYKEVFWLRTFGDLNYSEIGSLFDKSESWARVTYYRAKIMIREEME